MLRAYAADRVRSAEESLMATLEDGELMGRAALGLAEVCLARVRERDGSRVVGLVGPGNNGGDALWALAHLAGEGLECVALVGDWPVHEAGRTAASQGGVRVVGPGEDQVAAI
ncbi:MAG TPA: NAD(P)H-hydrate epimerase, partial [Pedococcus sp.]|nr:NAD(P)H-hydrate epimerase [Pedococcus sp.]